MDDNFFLCRATLGEFSEFLRCLKLYKDVSGQVINFHKSAITFGEQVDPVVRRLMAILLGIEKEVGFAIMLQWLQAKTTSMYR